MTGKAGKGKPGRPAKDDIHAGDMFGDLRIIQKVNTPPRSIGGQRYRVECVCGHRRTVPRFYLKRPNNPLRNCGCKLPKADEPYTKRSWYSMHQRCYSTTFFAYKDYGGRGIRVCERWHKDNPEGWENFKKDMGIRPQNYTIDRIDPDGHYEPSNCRWATAKEQSNNQRWRKKLDKEMEEHIASMKQGMESQGDETC